MEERRQHQFVFIWIGVALVATAICLAALLFLRIDSPVFLENYAEYRLPEKMTMVEEDQEERTYYVEEEFSLFYITNAFEDRSVIDLRFEEAPNLRFQATDMRNGSGMFWSDNSQQMQDKGYQQGIYSLRTIYLRFIEDEALIAAVEKGESIEVNRAKITYSDGSSESVDIGRIVLFPVNSENPMLEQRSVSGSNDGTATEEYVVKEKVDLMAVSGPLPEELEGLYEIKINGVDWEEAVGTSYEGGETILVDMSFPKEGAALPPFIAYGPKPALIFETSQGQVCENRLYNMNYGIHSAAELAPDFWSVAAYLNEKGAI